MGDAIPFDLSGSERITDPPLIDFLTHEDVLRAYVAEFVPDPHVSAEQKESVYLQDGTETARRVSELLTELSSVLKTSAVVKVAHAGRDNFDFHTDKGELIQLQNSPSSQVSFDVYAILQALSQEVQLEFLRQRRIGKAAG